MPLPGDGVCAVAFTSLYNNGKEVIDLLKGKWSPEQVTNYLRIHGSFTVSHETIYRYVLHDKKNGGTLFTYLRIMPKARKKRYNSKDSRGILALASATFPLVPLRLKHASTWATGRETP